MSDSGVSVFVCGPSSGKCQCKCPDGPCEHKWDGTHIDIPCYDAKGIPYMGGGSVTCSRCGMAAIDHDIWVMP